MPIPGRRRTWLPLVLPVLIAGLPAPAAVSIHTVTQSATEVGLYRPLTIRFGLSKSYINPYDPDVVNARFEFAGPSGITRTIPAFWSAESPPWMIRMVPLEVGEHACRIVVQDSTGDSDSVDLDFLALFSDDPGFVRVDPRNPRYLRYDNGRPYRPVGQNLCWYGGDSTFTTYLDRMASAQVNWSRYWMVPFVSQGIEWGGGVEGGAQGLGRYSQNNSRLFDTMLVSARDRGIRVQLVLDSFNGWNTTLFDNWDENPYNTANGGMLSGPIHYFTNPDAKRLARNLFRYIVARYAYNTGILCWELWNEVDAVSGSGGGFFGNEQTVAVWHRDMAQYIRSIDPFAHPITTSFADGGPRSSYAPVWQLPEMEIVQVHRYSSIYPDDHLSLIRSVRGFGKCIIMGEANPSGDLNVTDPGGSSIRLLHWASGVEESGAMSWWWDTWIHPRNIYWNHTPVARFLQNEDWALQGLSTVDVTRLVGTSFEIYGSSGPRHAYVFLRDFKSGVSGARLRLNQLIPGSYRVQFWNTGDGTVRSQTTVSTAGGGLIVDVPTFDWDIAFKVVPIGPAIAVTPQTLSADLPDGPSISAISVRNAADGTLDYQISADVPWLRLEPQAGSSSGESDSIEVHFEPDGVFPGVYQGTITVADATGVAPSQFVRVGLRLRRHRADLDGDGDVDLSDFGILQGCLSGSGLPYTTPCAPADFDADGDVDQGDVAALVQCMGGAGNQGVVDCLP